MFHQPAGRAGGTTDADGLNTLEPSRLDLLCIFDLLQGFFDALQDVSDEDLRAFTRAVGILDNAILPERQEEETALKRLP